MQSRLRSGSNSRAAAAVHRERRGSGQASRKLVGADPQLVALVRPELRSEQSPAGGALACPWPHGRVEGRLAALDFTEDRMVSHDPWARLSERHRSGGGHQHSADEQRGDAGRNRPEQFCSHCLFSFLRHRFAVGGRLFRTEIPGAADSITAQHASTRSRGFDEHRTWADENTPQAVRNDLLIALRSRTGDAGPRQLAGGAAQNSWR